MAYAPPSESQRTVSTGDPVTRRSSTTSGTPRCRASSTERDDESSGHEQQAVYLLLQQQADVGGFLVLGLIGVAEHDREALAAGRILDPAATVVKNGLPMSVSTSASVCVRLTCRLRASAFGT